MTHMEKCKNYNCDILKSQCNVFVYINIKSLFQQGINILMKHNNRLQLRGHNVTFFQRGLNNFVFFL